MINLLPQHAKRKLNREYRLRLGVIVLCAILVLKVVIALFFLPSFYMLSKSSSALLEAIEAKKAAVPPNGAEASRDVVTIRKELTQLAPSKFAPHVTPSQAFTEVFATKPQGVEVTAVGYLSAKEGIQIQLAGVADTREDILAYKNSLAQNKNFVVEKSTGDYILKKTNIAFTLNLLYKK